MGTLLVATVLIVIIALIIRNMAKDKRNGKSIHCGGECKYCGGHCQHK